MTKVEFLLAIISFQLFMIGIHVRWIYLKVKRDKTFDPQEPVNQYGENFTDAIQNSFVRGQCGISTYD
jgi:hypothetical protein